MEFPNGLLLDTLATYGELKSCTARKCYFKDEGLQHLENGARVVEFTRLNKDIPKQIVVQGVPIQLKYTGQPNTCFKCGSPDHLVRNCPKQTQPHGECNVQQAPHASMRVWGDTTLNGLPTPKSPTNSSEKSMDTTLAQDSKSHPTQTDSSDSPPNTTSGSGDVSQLLFTHSGS